MINRICGVLMTAGVVACSGDTLGPPAALQNPYTSLRLNAHAIVMSTAAPYDTLQLRVTPYDASGQPMPVTGHVTYSVSDTTIQVSPAGLLTARSKSLSSTVVIARLQDSTQNITHADTAYVLTTTTLPTAPIATFQIQRDSNKVDMAGALPTNKTLVITATDSTQKTIPTSALVKHFYSSDVTRATVTGKAGVVSAVTPGLVTITAYVTYYGRTLSDTIQLHVAYPDAQVMYIPKTLFGLGSSCSTAQLAKYVCPVNVTIGVGGTVVFEPSSSPLGIATVDTSVASFSLAYDVRFDDSTAVQASPTATATALHAATAPGSIDSVTVTYGRTRNAQGGFGAWSLPTTVCNVAPYPCYAARSFPTPGTYTFYSTVYGKSGKIFVLSNP